jgi:hypothetical protein
VKKNSHSENCGNIVAWKGYELSKILPDAVTTAVGSGIKQRHGADTTGSVAIVTASRVACQPIHVICLSF